MTDPEYEAASAARRANRRLQDVPNAVLGGQSIGECLDCGNSFDYGHGTDTIGLDPCPECGSHDWYKWGYRYEGEELRRDEAWDRYDSPPSVQTDGGQVEDGDWNPHDATCDDCGSSTHTNGEIVHCDSCDWWEEIDPSSTETAQEGGRDE